MTKINNQKLTTEDAARIEKEVTTHDCDPKYIVNDEQNPELNLYKCVMCGLRMSKKTKACSSCNQPYAMLSKVSGVCLKCTKPKILNETSHPKNQIKSKGPFYAL